MPEKQVISFVQPYVMFFLPLIVCTLLEYLLSHGFESQSTSFILAAHLFSSPCHVCNK